MLYEGFAHYGGMAGHDMEALAQGIREAADEAMVRHVIAQAVYLGGLLAEHGVPTVVPVGAHAVFLDAKRILRTCRRRSSRRSHSPRRSTSRAASARWSAASSPASTAARRTTGSSSCASRFRAASTRRSTSPTWPTWSPACARGRTRSPGSRSRYEPEHLRFFLGRFEPVAAYPDLGAETLHPELAVGR